jgi:iduronate 2-sulfatase
MRNRNLFLVFALLAVFFGCSAPKEKTETTTTKTDKNVLFIVIDDLNTTLGCYGHSVVKTPNIDKLAESGVKFNHAYCNYAVCGPSRSSFLTGFRPESINVLNNRTPLQDVLGDRITMPSLFKQNGFYTMSLGKVFHRNQRGYGDPTAWDEIYNFETTDLGKEGETRNMTDGVLKWCHWKIAEGEDEDQQDGQVAKKAVELIKTKRNEPFFLAVGFHKPHDPFIAPKKYFDMYPLEECDPPVLPDGWEPPYKHTLPGETKTFNKFTDQDKREFLRSYYACTSFMDAQVGKLMTALEESGQLENTLVVFFGDHGYHLGEHNWWNKVTIFEKGTNAPFIMSGNSVGKKGVESDAMFEYVDIYPTLAELLKLENTPEDLEGKSFAKVVDNPTLTFRSEVRAVIRRGEMLGRMVKNEDYRYLEWDNGNKGRELYDQEKDPVEYNNLAEKVEYKVIVDEMWELLYKE